MQGGRHNLWEVYARRLADEARRFSDTLAESMMGGNNPPGSVPVSKPEQLRRYLLLSAPRSSLSPDKQRESDDLWQKVFSGKSELEIKKWALGMAIEYNRLVNAGQSAGLYDGALMGMEPGLESEPYSSEPEPEPYSLGSDSDLEDI